MSLPLPRFSLPRFLIAAAHKSSGKTVLSSGIAAALTERGLDVGVFKKGPDYIDPLWLELAAGHAAYNLDFNTMGADELRALFASRARGRDVTLIEANKGLFDGVALDGSDSNAALAHLLKVPVVLVADTKGMTRGIAPLLLGYRSFDPDLEIAGVILNKTGGSRHESKLRAAVETYTDVPVLGTVGNAAELDISERHLGLTTPAEVAGNRAFLGRVAARISQGVDLDAILAAAQGATPLATVPPPQVSRVGEGLRIGIARDAAFAFYYADDLEVFTAAGATLVPVDLIHDPRLPDGLDGLFIGGGFPETHAAALAANTGMRDSVRGALEAGLPAYAECGGLMYLCRTLGWHDESHAMAGFLAADTVMHARPQGRGYARFHPADAALWRGCAGDEACAHEFHYASLENLTDPVFGRSVTRGHGIDGFHDALVRKNTQAGFVHMRHSRATPWVTDFLSFIAECRKARTLP